MDVLSQIRAPDWCCIISDWPYERFVQHHENIFTFEVSTEHLITPNTLFDLLAVMLKWLPQERSFVIWPQGLWNSSRPLGFFLKYNWLLTWAYAVGQFLARESGKPFAQTILASCPNFYKTVEKTRAIRCNNIGCTGTGRVHLLRS